MSRDGESGDGGQRDAGSCAPSNLPETCREFVCWSLREPMLILSKVTWLSLESRRLFWGALEQLSSKIS